jgi:hypothetical protein
VALDDARYDEATDKPTEGTVVDADDDLAALCNRVRSANRRCCAILFCDAPEPVVSPFRVPRHRTAASH